MHCRADVVTDAGELGVDGGARAPARSRLRLEHPHRQSGPGTADGGREPVGAATDDGDVRISCHPTPDVAALLPSGTSSRVAPLLASWASPGSLRSCPPGPVPGSLRSCPPAPNYSPLGWPREPPR